MEFRPATLAAFQALFADAEPRIAAFPGCLGLRLYADAHQPEVLYTHSAWESLAHLEAYRNSDLFRTTWAKTKALFGGKPQAFSLVEAKLA